MNIDQARQSIEFMQGAWPWATWNENTVAQWVDELAPVDFDLAAHVLRVARDELDTPPSHAWFRRLVKAEEERQRPVFAAIDAPALSDEENLAALAVVREQLARARAAGGSR